MPLNLSDTELSEFISKRILLAKFVAAAEGADADFGDEPPQELTPKEKQFYALIKLDLIAIHELLTNITEESPAGYMSSSKYRVKWSEHEYSQIATITQKGSDFFWIVSFHRESDIETKYMHVSTNGTVAELKAAFRNVQHRLYAAPELKIRRRRFMCSLLSRLSASPMLIYLLTSIRDNPTLYIVTK